MRKVTVLLAAFGILCAGTPSWTQQTSEGLTEDVKVKLMLIDALVMTSNGETVPDMKKEEFELKIAGADREIDTFDLYCPIGAQPDVKEIANLKQLKASTRTFDTPENPRKIVFVFDYYTIATTDRPQILNAAQEMLELWQPDNEEVMIAAIANGLRVEQRFTNDHRKAIRAMQRMEHDKTLWPIDYYTTTGKLWFDDLAVLMDVLAAYDGPKAVVFFSAGLGTGTQQEIWYQDVITRAVAGRSAFYPTFSAFSPNTGAAYLGALARLANSTGGRMPPNSSFDISISYARAQRDMSCRYVLGVYVDPEKSVKPEKLRLYVNRDGTQLRYPETFQVRSEEQTLASRMQAAYHDPEKFENPLVRAMAYPYRLKGKNKWDTLLAAHLEIPFEGAPRTLEFGANLMRVGTRIGKYRTEMVIDPPKEGDSRSVTIIGDRAFKPGRYRLVVVASEPGTKDRVASAEVEITIPEIPEGIMILRGPLMARVVKDGVLVRADKKEDKNNPNRAVLNDLIGDGSFEPLLVHEVSTKDTLMAGWEACMLVKDAPEGPFRAIRQVLDEDGKVVLEVASSALELRKKSGALCGGTLDSFKADVLSDGEYTLEVVVEYADSGDMITKAVAPFVVH